MDAEQLSLALKRLNLVIEKPEEIAGLFEILVDLVRLIFPPLDLTLAVLEFSEKTIIFAISALEEHPFGREQSAADSLKLILENHNRLIFRIQGDKRKLQTITDPLELPIGMA